MKPKIKIEACYDSFNVVMLNAVTGEEEQRFSFSQEESVMELKHVFQTLGFEAEYEEVY